MVELKVRKFGNSLGVILPREIIKRLQTGDGEKLFLIESAAGDYRLTPYDPTFEKKMEKAEEIMSRYRNALDALIKQRWILQEDRAPFLRLSEQEWDEAAK